MHDQLSNYVSYSILMNGFNDLVTKCCTLRLIAVCHAKDFDLTMKICKSSQQADKKGIL